MTQRTTEKLPEPNGNPVPHHETPTLGNPDLPQEGMQTTAGDPAGARMTGPQNRVMESQFPNQIEAPGTDISTQPFFWSSFNISPRRLGPRDHAARFRDLR
jgi:oxalate decarboxylase